MRCFHRWATVEVSKEDFERAQRETDRLREIAHDILTPQEG
jgi:hypothetical protein